MMSTGEGGMVLTGSRKLISRVRDLREYDQQRRYRTRYNYKMTDIQAAMGICQLERLAAFVRKRNMIAAKYNRAFAKVNLNCPVRHLERIYYRYVVQTANVQRCVDKAKSMGIACARPVFRPIHRLLGLKGFRESEAAWRKAFSLPIYPSLSNEQVNRIIDMLTQLCGENGRE
jgi:perosamine synthetase